MATPLRVGRYEALRPIASGGMATVYLGRAEGARGFERQVAIKAMHPHLAEDPEFVTMFLDEARMAANIRHPNVVPTLDVAEEDGQLFLVMEYVEGLSLQAMMRALRKRRRNLPVPVSLRISLDLLAGLHAAHELVMSDGTPMNLVHRDVSPPNVLVGVDGVSRIMDFGIARAEMRITSTRGTQVKGKIPYMSPEQLDARHVDRRSDIYAAGIVTWEILTGEPLFRADNQGALVTMVLAGASRPPSLINSEIPAAIDEVCMHALARSPDARYPTAAAFAEALESAAAQAHVTIATARVVSAIIKELPLTPSRGPDAIQTPSSQPDPSTLDPSSLSKTTELEVPHTPKHASSALRARVSSAPPPPPTNDRAIAIIASIAAALVLGGVFWFFTSGGPSSGLPASNRSPAATTSIAATVESSAPPASAEAPRPSAQAAASALPSSPLSAAPKPSAISPPAGSAQRPLKSPLPRSTATVFRPEEP